MPTALDDVYETRRENLTRLLREPGAKTQLAARLGASQSHITHLLKPPSAQSARAIREETARQIEEIMGLAMGQLDKPMQADMSIRAPDGRIVLVEMKHTQQADPAQVLEEAFRQVLETLSERDLTIPPEKAAKMARVVYEQALVAGKVDPSLVSTLIGLMT